MKRIPFLTVFIVISSISLWFLIGENLPSKEIHEEESSIRQSGYTFINPLLECENNTSFAKQKYIPFEKTIINRISDEIEKTYSGTTIAIYFRNLNNGPWFWIHENEEFIPASLMKVTLMISYLKWSEEEPALMEKRTKVTSIVWLNQLIPPEKKLEIGKEYTVRELLYYLIAYSDNTASTILFNNISSERQDKTFSELSIPIPDQDPNYSLTVKEYASFFRILYNASYLSKKSSEEGLSLLSQSGFKDGIVSSLPKDIVVAHKFGEREKKNEDGKIINQLHDCGIVYYPEYPYLLCVMTRWESSLTDLSTIIWKTSSIIFEEIGKTYPIKQKLPE